MIPAPPVMLSKVSKNQTIQGLALLLTITVSLATIWYLFHQSKLTRLQIQKVKKDEGEKKDSVKSNFNGIPPAPLPEPSKHNFTCKDLIRSSMGFSQAA